MENDFGRHQNIFMILCVWYYLRMNLDSVWFNFTGIEYNEIKNDFKMFVNAFFVLDSTCLVYFRNGFNIN